MKLISKVVNFYKLALLSITGALLLSATASANLFIVPPPGANDGVISGVNGIVSVTESITWGEIGNDIEYMLDILDETSSLNITLFAISTNTAAEFEGGVYAERLGWSGMQLTAADWDNNWAALNNGGDQITPFSLGDFSDLFGDDLYVNIFSWDGVAAGSAIDTASDESFEFFQTNSYLYSNFIALNASGTIVDQSLSPTSVPEPSSMAILALGLLGFAARKYKN